MKRQRWFTCKECGTSGICVEGEGTHCGKPITKYLSDKMEPLFESGDRVHVARSVMGSSGFEGQTGQVLRIAQPHGFVVVDFGETSGLMLPEDLDLVS